MSLKCLRIILARWPRFCNQLDFNRGANVPEKKGVDDKWHQLVPGLTAKLTPKHCTVITVFAGNSEVASLKIADTSQRKWNEICLVYQHSDDSESESPTTRANDSPTWLETTLICKWFHAKGKRRLKEGKKMASHPLEEGWNQFSLFFWEKNAMTCLH